MKTLRICALLLMQLTVSSVAFAQAETDREAAKQLYVQANDLRDAGNLRAALPKYQSAYALAKTTVLGLATAKTHADLGELVEARDVLLSVSRIEVKPDDSQRVKDARAEAARLEGDLQRRIPSLTIAVTGATLDTITLVVDGVIVTDPTSMPRRLNPGPHTVIGKLAGVPDQRGTVHLMEGGQQSLTLHFQAAASEPALQRPMATSHQEPAREDKEERKEKPSRGPLPWIVGGAGLAVLTFSLIAGAEALATKSKFNDHCDENFRCDPDGMAAADHGSYFATMSTVTFFIGAAGVVGSAILFILPPSKDGHATTLAPTMTANGGGLTLRHSFK